MNVRRCCMAVPFPVSHHARACPNGRVGRLCAGMHVDHDVGLQTSGARRSGLPTRSFPGRVLSCEFAVPCKLAADDGIYRCRSGTQTVSNLMPPTGLYCVETPHCSPCRASFFIPSLLLNLPSAQRSIVRPPLHLYLTPIPALSPARCSGSYNNVTAPTTPLFC